jgi:Bax protein
MDTRTDNDNHSGSAGFQSACSCISGKKLFLTAVALVGLIATGVPSLKSAVAPERNSVQQETVQPLQQSFPLQEPGRLETEKTFAPPADTIVNALKQCSLWEIDRWADVPPVLFDRYPENLCDIEDISVKKRVFLHTLLPVVLTALQEIDNERDIVLAIIEKQNQGLPLDSREQRILSSKIRKYRAVDNEELLVKLNRIPVSLILAQAAVESSWGSSRFTRDGNNLFGMWTWGERGIVPERRDEGQTHKVRIYDSILDSVRSYILTLNRHTAYEPFRTVRQESTDSLSLINGLKAYSSRGEAYIEELARVITYNDLQKYDQCRLAAAKTIKVSASSLTTTIQ